MTLEGAAPGFQGSRPFGTMRDVWIGFGPLEPGATIARVTLEGPPPEPKLELYGEFAFGITFSDPTGRDKVVEGMPVFDTLLAIYRLVSDLIVRMEFICKA